MKNQREQLLSQFSGTYCCRNDERLTIEEGKTGLCGLFGDTKDGLLELILPEYRDVFLKELKEQLAGGDEVEILVPVEKKTGQRTWMLNRASLLRDADGREYLVGLMVDATRLKLRYDAEKLVTQELREQAEQDSLTKVYNARTARKLAETYLAEAGGATDCVLLILDLDDFKQINDRYGHMFGDAVLVQAARAIKNLFRSQDIVGRIGGEEFMVLMKDVSDRKIVDERCSQLNEVFRAIMADQMDGKLSCSIGAAFAPVHGEGYFELFSHADQALYQAKGLGKDRYVFYDPEWTKAKNAKCAHKFKDYDAEVFRGYIDFE